MELRDGYKQTNVGLIPNDWRCVPICSLAKLESGHTPSRRESGYWGGDIPWVSLHDTDALNGSEITATQYYVTQKGIDHSSARLLPAGTVVFSRTATVGRTTRLGRPMATSQDFANYICGPELDSQFLVYLFRGMEKTWASMMAGSTHKTIYMPAFQKLEIAVPPIEEQRAIATALSDVDALLEGLGRLIAKKRGVKQAAMQQLLTGQNRLPGFKGEWEVKRLGEHVTFLRNGVNSRAELTIDDPVKYLHYGDVHGCSGTSMSPKDLPSLPTEKTKTLGRLANGDLIFADASEDLEGIGKSAEIRDADDVEAVSGLHTIAARFDKNVLADGFKAYLQFCPAFIRHLRRLAAGTKVYATNRAHIATAEMALPDVDEQVAIASVFKDMDAEIEALEQRRAKTRDLKQAMMQELLTGRTRLI